MKAPLALSTVLALSGCTAVQESPDVPGPGSIADAATTYSGLVHYGATELNPLIASIGNPVATALATIGLKAGYKRAVTEYTDTSLECADASVEAIGIASAAWNLGVMAGAATGIGVPLAIGAGWAYWRNRDCTHEPEPDLPAIRYRGEEWYVLSLGATRSGRTYTTLQHPQDARQVGVWLPEEK